MEVGGRHLGIVSDLERRHRRRCDEGSYFESPRRGQARRDRWQKRSVEKAAAVQTWLKQVEKILRRWQARSIPPIRLLRGCSSCGAIRRRRRWRRSRRSSLVATELKQRGLNTVLIEKGCVVNSLYNYPTHMVFFTTPELLEIGGLPMTSLNEKPGRTEALKYYRRVAEYYCLNIRQYERVLAITGDDGEFLITTSKAEYSARKTAFSPPATTTS